MPQLQIDFINKYAINSMTSSSSKINGKKTSYYKGFLHIYNLDEEYIKSNICIISEINNNCNSIAVGQITHM